MRAAVAGCHQLRERAVQIELLGNAAPEIEVSDWVLAHPPRSPTSAAGWSSSNSGHGGASPARNVPRPAALHERYARRGLTVLALTSYAAGPGSRPGTDLTVERELIRQTVVDLGVEFAVGIAPDGRLKARYGGAGMPSFAVVDRAGVVQLASSKPDEANLEKVIADLLNVSNGNAN